ncbi:MAG: hypothetical protein NTV49_13680 [Kiritimatiellaeota bacterium]|nr:hypothetical protein [Kiritimatiellota bacterium]
MKPSAWLVGIGLMILAPLVLITSVGYTITLPRLYEAEAKIAVHGDQPDMEVFPATTTNAPLKGPLLRTEMEIIQSRPILYTVIDNLNLGKEWGQKRNEDRAPIPREYAYAILQGGLRVQPYRDTSLISIVVRTEDFEEAARIANEIAVVYRNRRIQEARKRLMRGIEALESESEKQQNKVQRAAEILERMCQELGVAPRGARIPSGDGPADLKAWRDKYLPIDKAETDMEQGRALLAELKHTLARAGIEIDMPRTPVEMVDPAVPNPAPVSPNSFQIIMMSAIVAGVLLLLGKVLVHTSAAAGRKKPWNVLPGG